MHNLQKSGNLRHKTKDRAILTEQPSELCEIDLIGPLKSHNGVKKYIIMEIDHFNKWVEANIILDKRPERSLTWYRIT